MSRRFTYDPSVSHYWEAEGTGELSSRWVRPACDRTIRRHVTDFAQAVDTDTAPVGACPTCLPIMRAMTAV